MTLKITQRDIQTGVRSNAYKCPIARALNRAGIIGMVLPGSVRMDEPVSERVPGTYTRCAWANLSKKAEKFIEDFDKKKKVKPITIILRFGDYA